MKRKLTLLITTLFMLSACSESLETTFSVDGEILRMDGVITSQTPNQIKTLFAENPAIFQRLSWAKSLALLMTRRIWKSPNG